MDFMQFFEMLLHVDKYMGLFIAQYGTMIYAVLFAIIFCETGLIVVPFLPGDTLLFIAGAFCAAGSMNIWLLMVLLIVAAILISLLEPQPPATDTIRPPAVTVQYCASAVADGCAPGVSATM